MKRFFKDLIVWQKAILLVTDIYKVTRSFPKDEIYGLTNQLRRAAVSVPSNIAEGQGRLSEKEFQQFLAIARGSLMEVETQIHIARNLGYLSEAHLDGLMEKEAEVGRLLNGLMNSLAKGAAAID
ncbi:MAG: four helix bundle protein [Acidobacteriales bacterium]|nr:four helix bundle protein [Terriglobales bacterium]